MRKDLLIKKTPRRIAALAMAMALCINGCGAAKPDAPATTAADAASDTSAAVTEQAASQTAETAAAAIAEPAAAPQPDASERWDLTDIYPSEEAFRSDMTKLEKEYIPGMEQFRGKLGTADEVLACFQYSEEAIALYTKLQNYVALRTTLNQKDSAATADYGAFMRLAQGYSDASTYISKELYENDDAFLDRLIADERFAPYKNQLMREREQKNHLLEEQEEQLLIPLMSLAYGANTLYTKLTNADMEFPTVKDSQGTEYEVNESIWRDLIYTNPDRTLRENMTRALYSAYGKYRNTLAQNMDNFVQAMVAAAHFHHYDSAREASLALSSVPLAVYDNLLATANSHLEVRYKALNLRKETLGYDFLSNQDVYLPLAADTDRTYPYQEAKELVLEALAPLGESYCRDFKKGLDSNWIDVYPADGKQTNAACFGVYGVHPYVYLNYGGSYDSMSTLAHEMGHAMHDYYSDQYQQSSYNKNATIFAAEVASTANELLLSDYMIAHAGSEEEKLFYLSNQLTLLDSTFFNQTMYAEFETGMYQIVEDGGTLTPDILEELWVDIYRKYYGPDLQPLEENRYNWSRISHFYGDYYVFQYATSIAASSDIVDRITGGEKGAVDQYLEFLQAGDSTDAVSTLKIAGVDMTAPTAYDAIFNRYENLIRQMEELLK